MTERLSLTEALAGAVDDRYQRQRLIDWWEQERLAQARVLVVGAGALGNEILKLLALLGVGRTLVVDMDAIERSNLSRGVLFRDGDEGLPKARAAAARLRELNPDVRVEPLVADVAHGVGLGVFLWADLVLAGVDNRQARVFVNQACAWTARPWVDGGLEGLAGVARVFDPARGACYECTMSALDRRIVAERRSCALLARRAAEAGRVPSTAVAASLVAALQVQEAVKLLHGRPALFGEGLHFDGSGPEFSRVRYPRRDDCTAHEPLPPPVPLGRSVRDTTVGRLLDLAARELGEGAVIDLSRDVVVGLECPACARVDRWGAPLGAVDEAQAKCPRCGTHRIVHFVGSLSPGDGLDADRTLADIGIPRFDAVVARRGIGRRETWVFDGDAADVLGTLADDGGPVLRGEGRAGEGNHRGTT